MVAFWPVFKLDSGSSKFAGSWEVFMIPDNKEHFKDSGQKATNVTINPWTTTQQEKTLSTKEKQTSAKRAPKKNHKPYKTIPPGLSPSSQHWSSSPRPRKVTTRRNEGSCIWVWFRSGSNRSGWPFQLFSLKKMSSTASSSFLFGKIWNSSPFLPQNVGVVGGLKPFQKY